MSPNGMMSAWLRVSVTLASFAGLLVLGGCGGGSGAPNNPYAPGPTVPGPLFILPASATIYSNIPSTLTISGGAPPYFVVSSNSVILPVSSSAPAGTVILLAANVATDTTVIITAQDSIGQTATSTITVKAAPIFNTLTVKPNATTCGTNAVCSGQTATATVTVIGPGGAGIANRLVKFDVVTGDYAIESNDPANPLVSTLTVATDVNGVAQVILKANVSAFTQPALLRATELTTGNQQTAQFTIVQTINGAAVLSVVPSTANITGAFENVCSTGFRIDYYIYGGTPPYRITSTFPDSVTLVNSIVTTSGGFFEAITNGSCVNPLVFSIFDAVGLQTTATLINVPGSAAQPAPPPPPLVVTPSSQSGKCTGTTFAVLITGGTPPYNISGTGGTINPQTPASPGYVLISGLLPGGAPPPTTSTYNYLVVDSSAPQLTQPFSITCTS